MQTEQIRNQRATKTSPVAQRDDLRSHWLSETVRACQGLLSQSLHVGPNYLPGMAATFLEGLAAPVTPVERLVQRGLLLEVAVQFGHAAHTTFHRQHKDDQPDADRCGFLPAIAVEGWPRDLALSPAEAFRRWSKRYAEAFREAHPLSCAREAEDYLTHHFRLPVSAANIADQLACPSAFLRRTFKQLTGKSLLEYQSELRLKAALRLLSDSDLKMEAIALEVGYRSKKDLYRVVQTHMACTPLEYRQAQQSRKGDSGKSRKVN
jgi:transcriptional regulator GlxA family with amidase domain